MFVVFELLKFGVFRERVKNGNFIHTLYISVGSVLGVDLLTHPPSKIVRKSDSQETF